MPHRPNAPLSPLENAVLRVLWDRQHSTAEDVRTALARSQPMKDSTVRTILRRLEEKGYVTHTTDGRTYVYEARIESRSVAADAVRSIVDKFCAGSVEDLLVGMVDGEIVSPQKLQQLADRIAKAEAVKRKLKSN